MVQPLEVCPIESGGIGEMITIERWNTLGGLVERLGYKWVRYE